MLLPEPECEAIISQRLEEKQRVLDKVNVSMLLNTHRKRPESPETETVSSAANVSRNSTVMLWTKVSSLTYIPRQTLLLTAGKVEGLAALAEKRRVNKERDADKVSAIINVVHVTVREYA